MIKVAFGMILGSLLTIGILSQSPKILDSTLEIAYQIEAKIRG